VVHSLSTMVAMALLYRTLPSTTLGNHGSVSQTVRPCDRKDRKT
jgi:hypothetical protein